jgi:hypothetical protein
MNIELQSKLIQALASADMLWRADWRYGSPSKPMLKWVSVTRLDKPRIELGLSSEAGWVRITEAAVTEYKPGKPCVFLLPVLEIDLGDAHRALEQGVQARGLSTEFITVFPFEEVVATGLESHSEHWAGLALKWAEQMPSTPRLQNALQTMTKSGPTQKLRHAAQKLVTRHSS